MRIMRYLLEDFLRKFGLFLAGLTIVVTLFSVFDEMNRVFRYDPPLWAAAAFFACKVPKTIVEVMPLAVLLGTLFTLAAMLRSHELIAIRASGVSQYAIAAPFLGVALVVSIFSIVFGETVMPWASEKRVDIKKTHILKLKPVVWRTAWHMAVWTTWESGPRLAYVRHASEGSDLLEEVCILDFKDHKPVARVDAKSVRPVRGAWEMADAQVYRWRRDGLRLNRHKLAVYPVDASMGDFMREEKPVEAQTMADLARSIERLRKTGQHHGKEQVFYYLKWAYPFANLIVALLGLGISFSLQSSPREGQAAAIIVAIVAAFGYIGLAQLGQTLGVGGVLPPLVAMWMANVVFLLAGIVLLWRAWRY